MKFFDRPALAQILANGIKELQLDLNDKQQGQLLDYLALLFKWNAVYNLTSVRDPMQMMTHHVLDSLAAVSSFAGATNVLDVGAGSGVLAIAAAPGLGLGFGVKGIIGAMLSGISMANLHGLMEAPQ